MGVVTNWNTTFIDGKEFLVIDVAKFRIPLGWDPSSNMFMAVAAPDGGVGNFPALLRGEDGEVPSIDNVIDFTPLPSDGSIPDYASWAETSPNVYRLSLGLRTGQDGETGVMILDPTTYGTPVAGQILVVKDDLAGFELVVNKIGNRYYPAAIANAPSGNPAYTLCAIPIPAQGFDWFPSIEGQAVVTGTGPDFRGDLMCRLSTSGIINGESAGPIVARAFGGTGVNTPTQVLSSAMAANAPVNADRILGTNSAVIYLRVERQAGANTFTTLADSTICRVKVEPIP